MTNVALEQAVEQLDTLILNYWLLCDCTDSFSLLFTSNILRHICVTGIIRQIVWPISFSF